MGSCYIPTERSEEGRTYALLGPNRTNNVRTKNLCHAAPLSALSGFC